MLETVARHWKDALLTVCSLLFSYLCLEIAYRIDQHQTLPEKISKTVAQVGSTGVSPLYRFDKYTGYRYAAMGYTTVFDAAGNQTVKIDARGNRTTTAFDALNRAYQVTDALNDITTSLFDAAGNQANARFGALISNRDARRMQGSLRLSF